MNFLVNMADIHSFSEDNWYYMNHLPDSHGDVAQDVVGCNLMTFVPQRSKRGNSKVVLEKGEMRFILGTLTW